MLNLKHISFSLEEKNSSCIYLIVRVLTCLPSRQHVESRSRSLNKQVESTCLVSSHGNYNGGKGFAGGYIPNGWNYGRGGYEDTPRSSGYSTNTAELLLAGWEKLAKKK